MGYPPKRKSRHIPSPEVPTDPGWEERLDALWNPPEIFVFWNQTMYVIHPKALGVIWSVD